MQKIIWLLSLLFIGLVTRAQLLSPTEWLNLETFPGIALSKPVSLISYSSVEFFGRVLPPGRENSTFIFVADAGKDTVFVIEFKVIKTGSTYTRSATVIGAYHTPAPPVFLSKGFQNKSNLSGTDGVIQFIILCQARDVDGKALSMSFNPREIPLRFNLFKTITAGKGLRNCAMYTPDYDNQVCFLVSENAYDVSGSRQIQAVYYNGNTEAYTSEPPGDCSSGGNPARQILTGPCDADLIGGRLLVTDFNNKKLFVFDKNTGIPPSCAALNNMELFLALPTEGNIRQTCTASKINTTTLLMPCRLYCGPSTGGDVFVVSTLDQLTGQHGILLYNKDWIPYGVPNFFKDGNQFKYFPSSVTAERQRAGRIYFENWSDSYWVYQAHNTARGITKYEILKGGENKCTSYNVTIMPGSESITATDMNFIKMVAGNGVSNKTDMIIADAAMGTVYLHAR